MTERERLIELLCKAPLGGYPFEKQYYKSAITKFADYLLDSGVIVPPCKVGDDVYEVDNGGKIYESKVRRIIYVTPLVWFDETAIGKSVFLNFDEAAEKAKERKVMARYIDAEEITQRVRNEIKEQMVLTSDIGFMAFLQGFLKLFEQKIREEPTADVQEVKHGKWKCIEGVYCCSVCGDYVSCASIYCPICGAKMDKE